MLAPGEARLWVGLVLEMLDTLGILPQGAAQYKFYCWVGVAGGSWHHTYYYLSGQLRRWGYLDLSSKPVFFPTQGGFFPLMGPLG